MEHASVDLCWGDILCHIESYDVPGDRYQEKKSEDHDYAKNGIFDDATRSFHPIIFSLGKYKQGSSPDYSDHCKYSPKKNKTRNNIRNKLLYWIRLKRVEERRKFQCIHKRRIRRVTRGLRGF